MPRWLLLLFSFVLVACGTDTTPVRSEGPTTTTAAATDAPRIGDHWHLAIGVSRCGSELPPFEQEPQDLLGIHTHGEGLIHVHPFSSEVTGVRAVLSAFFTDVSATVDDEGLHLPDGTTLPYTGSCSDEEAHLVVRRWRSRSDAAPTTTTVRRPADLLDQPLRPDGGVIAIAFATDPTEVGLPTSAAQLRDPTAAEQGRPPQDSTQAQRTGVRPPGGLVFAPVLTTHEPPCSATAVPEHDETTCYELGPSLAGAIEAADPMKAPTGAWGVSMKLTEAGVTGFNRIAAACYGHADSCPSGQLAVVVDGTVWSAPTIQAERFERDQIQITGNFTESEAKALASLLQPTR